MNTKILLLGLLAFCFLAGAYYYGDQVYSTSAYYAVMLDDRGLASAVLRLDYANNGAEGVDSLTLDIPGRDVQVVNVFMLKEHPPEKVPCDRAYYDCGGEEFERIEFQKLGANTYKLDLNETIEPGKDAKLLIYYRAFGYAKDELTGKRFDFETVKYGFDVDSTRVAIDVDEDLILKEGGSKGNYQQMRSAVLAGSSSSGGDLQMAQASLSSSYSYTGRASGYVKEKSTLLKGETFTVSGVYGREWLQLYAPEIALVLVVLGATAWFATRKTKEDAAKRKADARMEAKGEVAAKTGLGETALLSFMCAVAFAVIVSLAIGVILAAQVRTEAGPLVLTSLVGWVATAIWVYGRGDREGHGLAAAMMFLGFTIIVLPFAMVVTAWIVTLLRPPYYL